MSIFGDGSQTRAFTYIQDVAPIIARAPRVKAAYNQVFNIGADKNYTVKELARQVARAMGVPGHPIQHLDARNEVKHAYSSHRKLEKAFASKSKHTLDEGLAHMAAWVRRHGAKQSRPFGGIEIEKNLPPSWKR